MIPQIVQDAIIEMYKQENPRISVVSICVEFGLQPPSLYHVLRSNDISLRGKYVPAIKPRDPEPLYVIGRTALINRVYAVATKQRIVDLYERGDVASGSVLGWSARKISFTLNIPYHHVVKILHQARVQILPGNSKRTWEEVKKEILDAFADKTRSLDDITAEFGIPLNTLYRMVQHDPRVEHAREVMTLGGRIEAVIEEVLRRVKEDLVMETMGAALGSELAKLTPQAPVQLPLWNASGIGPIPIGPVEGDSRVEGGREDGGGYVVVDSRLL